MLDKVLRNAHGAYLCELAQMVAIMIDEIINGHAFVSGQIPVRLVTCARQTPHCCLASRKPLLLSSEVADDGFPVALGVADSARAVWHGGHQQQHQWTHCTPDGKILPDSSVISGFHRPVTDRGFLVDHESSDTAQKRHEIAGANRGDVGATAPIT
jgi:hypothetical protein